MEEEETWFCYSASTIKEWCCELVIQCNISFILFLLCWFLQPVCLCSFFFSLKLVTFNQIIGSEVGVYSNSF